MKKIDDKPDGKPAGYRLRCPACGHADDVLDDPAVSTYACDECGCRIAHGVELPRVFILPAQDRRFICLRLASGPAAGDKTYERDLSVALERRYASGIGLDLISVADPALFQDFLVFLASRKMAEGAVPEDGTRVPSKPAAEPQPHQDALGLD